MKSENSEILPVWQPPGCSTHLIAKRISEKLHLPTSHTGTLDPMAEGVIIVLAGETRFKKYEFAEWVKEYEFEILAGVSTDTLDAMGIFLGAANFSDYEFSKEKFAAFIGNYEQKYPIYSTKKIQGKHLHEYARENLPVKIPTKSGEIYELEFLGFNNIPKDEILESVVSRISKIKGDFRQDEIIKQWKKFIKSKTTPNSFKIAKFRVKMSKGLYVRVLANEICEKNKLSGICYTIVRTRNGDYTRENSKTLEEFEISLD